jgi:hypothetical protein
MKTVVQLLYTVVFSLGVAGVFLTLYRFLKDRSDGIRFFLLSFMVFTLHTATILVSYYFGVLEAAAGAQMVVSRVNRYLLAISVCFVSSSIFLCFRCRFRIRLTRFKRALYGVLIFLVPQFLFSSSRIGVVSGGRTGADFFQVVALMVALCTAAMLAVRSAKAEMKSRAAVLRFLLGGTGALLLGQLTDLYLKFSGSYSALSFTVFGYAALSSCTIAAVFHHARRVTFPAAKAFIRVLAICGISRREQEIVDLIIKGYSNRRIAETLFISVSTEDSYREHLSQGRYKQQDGTFRHAQERTGRGGPGEIRAPLKIIPKYY